jgi:pimeloyl-ACP methyl ester carboxylesterase
MVGTDRPGVAASPAGDPGSDDAGDPGRRVAAYPRLVRHRLNVGGHRVGVAVGGRGVPLVLASGLLLTDRLYVQTLSRLAACGFRVVAVDVAGSGISDDGKGLDEYGRLLGQVLDTLEVERAVLAGHSLGGRLVTELAARRPERVVALLLVDASVGAPWDMLVRLVGYAPASVGVLGAMLLADTLGTVPFARDLGQAAKLSRLAVPVMLGHLGAPWRLLGPGLSALYAAASAPLLDRVGAAGVPVVVVHGDYDLVVPMATARDAARRTGGELVVVHGAAHSFVLQDPETLPAIVRELLGGRLGQARARAVAAAGLGPDASLAAVDEAFAPAGSRLGLLGPPEPDPRPVPAPRPPHYSWTRTTMPVAEGAAPGVTPVSGPARARPG